MYKVIINDQFFDERPASDIKSKYRADKPLEFGGSSKPRKLSFINNNPRLSKRGENLVNK